MEGRINQVGLSVNKKTTSFEVVFLYVFVLQTSFIRELEIVL